MMDKLSEWDSLLSKKIKTDSDLKRMGQLLHDYTVYAYAMLKLDGKPLVLFDYQDRIINDKHRFIIFRAANQIGKSFLFDVMATINLCIDHGHGHNEAIVSKSLPQATHQMRRIKQLLNSSNFDWKQDVGVSDNMSVLTMDIKDANGNVKYTNLLIIAPCTEGLLGYDLHQLNLDEFEYWDVDLDYFFHQIAQPRTYSTKGRIMIMSNPNGSDNIVAKFEQQRTLKGELKWHTYIHNYLDKPGNTLEEYEELKHSMSRQQFESTVAAIRSISSKTYFTIEEIEKSFDERCTMERMVGKQPFFFLDVGSKHDQSVLVGGYCEPDDENPKFKHVWLPIVHVYPVGYPMARVVGSEVIDDGWHHEKSVREHLLEWAQDGVLPQFGVDVTGNSGISPLLNTLGIFPVDVVFSGPKKSGMYQRFKYYMEKGLLHRVRSSEWERQAKTLIMTKSDRGYLKIHHETEDDLDDCMDATAGAIYLMDNPDVVEYSMVVV